MWGMNVSKIPFSDAPYGFFMLLVVQLALGAALLSFRRWRRLL